ncbi:MAG TPA: hypothetical protein VES66_10640 [Terriglobales bacterium]|nr:hypothetical protein [Terriglobales bacterium]
MPLVVILVLFSVAGLGAAGREPPSANAAQVAGKNVGTNKDADDALRKRVSAQLNAIAKELKQKCKKDPSLSQAAQEVADGLVNKMDKNEAANKLDSLSGRIDKNTELSDKDKKEIKGGLSKASKDLRGGQQK